MNIIERATTAARRRVTEPLGIKNKSHSTVTYLTAATWYLFKHGITVFDRRFLVTSAILTVLTQFPFFMLSILRLSDKVEDFSYGLSFVLVSASLLLIKSTYHLRQVMVTFMTCLWGLRLSSFLLYRTYHMEHDFRLESFKRTVSGTISYWSYQALSIWANLLPVTLLNSFTHDAPVGMMDIIGYLLWGVGFAIENIADYQKFTFKEHHKDRWCNVGLYRFSRHPNYFGEVLLWFGIFCCCTPVLYGWTMISVLAPILHMFTILFVSGIPPLERKNNEHFGQDPNYLRYKEVTPIFIPAIPRSNIQQKMKKFE